MHWRAERWVNVGIAALQWTWGLVQTCVGIIWLAVNIPFITGAGMINGHFIWESKLRLGVSLGYFIFVWERASDDVVSHEYGHCLQSAILGPLYLPVCGIPSFIRTFKARRMWRKEGADAASKWYYSGYPESWADRLGGVDR